MDELARAGQVSRREVLKKGLLGAAGLTVLPTVLAACTNAAATPTATADTCCNAGPRSGDPDSRGGNPDPRGGPDRYRHTRFELL